MQSNCKELPQRYNLRAGMLTCTRERMFAKPFLGQLGSGHVQGVYSMCKVSSHSLPSGRGTGMNVTLTTCRTKAR
jgi:hypothetical protein